MKYLIKLRVNHNKQIEEIKKAIKDFLIRLISEIVIRLLSDYLIKLV